MTAIRSIEDHLRRHSDQLKNRVYVFLNITALVLSTSLILEFFIETWPTQQVLEIVAYAVIAVSIFAITCNFLYARLDSIARTEKSVIAQPESPATRLETIGRLAGGVAHDFNNSLMVLLNCIEVMSRTEDAMTRQSLLADMESAAKGAQSTAQQLMSLSREGGSLSQPSDPRAALRSIASNLRRIFPENVVIKDLLRGTPPVTLLNGQFEQVILKICLNAKDAMPNGGELTLRCFKDPIEDEVIIEIDDTAGRQDPDRFRQLEESIIYECVTAVGGRLTTRLVEGVGTSITLSLPIAERVPGSEEPTESMIEANQSKVLLLDDNELVLTVLNARLDLAGYSVSTALSVKEATRLVKAETFDFLVCDAVLKDGTPKEVIECFRHKSNGPIVICSGYSKNDPLLAELETDSVVFLQKPFSIDELTRRLDSATKAA